MMSLMLLFNVYSLASPEDSPRVAENNAKNCEEGRLCYIYSRINGNIVAIEESIFTSTYGYEITYYFKSGELIAAHARIITPNTELLEKKGEIYYTSTEHNLSPSDNLDDITHGRKKGNIIQHANAAMKQCNDSD